jgi:16S rRNA (cytidine1402-2'-O)-methyltransferase
MNNESGKLYLVATPLGNLEDITQRALRILGEVDLIAAEDTRHTLKLLNYFGIKKRMVSYFQHNEKEKAGLIITRLQEGENVALVTDAGMPGISDPGNWLVAEAVKQGITVIPIPGASAVITALAASGLDTGSFWFEGFLPRKTTEQRAKLREMAAFNGTMVFYEAPHRLGQTLKHMLEVMGDRRVVLARELTKLHEEFIRGNLGEIINQIEEEKVRGEFTIVIEGTKETVKNHQNSAFDESQLFAEMDVTGSTLKKELRLIAEKTGKSMKEIYQLYLINQEKK